MARPIRPASDEELQVAQQLDGNPSLTLQQLDRDKLLLTWVREVATRQRYRDSEKGKEVQRKHNKSESGRRSQRRYNHSPNGKEAQRRSRQKQRDTLQDLKRQLSLQEDTS